ncbi:hypothetical protein C7447_101234 [Tenacibaculum adriaticum]|uniref:Glycine dehydrogenase n=1 Tax=Tenacibaculum adriaticum TaxID=413713 RepID=A0A5S5DV90_9FLAO|nr:hypothetical protein [Tenacibaculum adriaticum]TYP99634.1 hypothetical protein C7447_101234 [Tenacibaculum adriaticum]
MFKFLGITCEQANEICNKAQYNEANFTEKLKLNWHLLVCKVCTLYSKQNNTLTKVYKIKANECRKQKFCLNNKEKELLKEEMKKTSLQ